jgi:hypothetical protein
MRLEVQPPRRLGPTPPVHRHRDQVGPVLDVADDDPTRTAATSTRRGQMRRPPPPRLRPPQAEPAATHRRSARCPCQKVTRNQRGGSRADRRPVFAGRA